MKHVMYITGGVSEPMMEYSWASTFGIYHPCKLFSGLTHAWSIWVFAVCIFEYIIKYWVLWCVLPDFVRL